MQFLYRLLSELWCGTGEINKMKKELIILILSVLTYNVYAGEIYKNMPGLVELWHFNGSSYAVAEINPAHAANMGAGCSFTTGKYGKSGLFTFNPCAGATFNDTGLPTGNNPRSLSFWYYGNSTTANYERLFAYGAWNTNNSAFVIYFSAGDNTLVFDSYGSGNTYIFTKNPPTKFYHKWTHLTFVLYSSGQYMNLFINGKLNRLLTFTKSINTALDKDRSAIGGAGGQTNAGANGVIDDIAVWNISLSTAQVYNIYSQTRKKYQ